MLFAGIDVGQSGTTAAIGDGLQTLAIGHAGPGDEIGASAESTRLRDAMRDALADALVRASLPASTRFDAVVAGISGYEGHVVGARPDLPSERVTLMHDAPVAHAAAFRDESGVLVIAGTGSVAFARSQSGRTQTVGGWGYLFGDEGSAFWIARSAFESAIDCGQGCASKIAAYFDASGLRAVARAFYEGRIDRAGFARIASTAFEAHAPHCLRKAAERGCTELMLLAQRALLDPPEQSRIAFTGGLMRVAEYAERLREETVNVMPDTAVDIVHRDPAEGALYLAARA